MLTKFLLAMLTAWPVQMAEGGQLHGSGGPPAGEVETAKESGTPQEPPAEGLWPSQTLVRLFVLRICEDVSNKYGLDDDQSRRYQEAEVKRWSDFASAHRAEIQPVINEFIEMRMELEPPAKERVQAWARRATSRTVSPVWAPNSLPLMLSFTSVLAFEAAADGALVLAVLNSASLQRARASPATRPRRRRTGRPGDRNRIWCIGLGR